ncbi:myosin-IIIb-like [Pelobates cultripes]|uniref:Myosin-IIIb-like n=1 Tax=Pelobates cultripes TaxID=61616 RepID=A0AAD1WCD7_PELCU|nr:myosin-IIIb-like [Pelobates cultripes]
MGSPHWLVEEVCKPAPKDGAIRGASDISFVEKLTSGCKSNPCFERARGKDPGFVIHHYAGKVHYTAVGFLEKNRDTLPMNVQSLFMNSVISLLSVLFTASISRTGTLTPMQRAKVQVAQERFPSRKMSVGAQFRQSLSVLMEKMYLSSPHFIRCIKPNNKKDPLVFETELVLDQLRYNGLMETVRIRRDGFSWRPSFQEFVGRFGILLLRPNVDMSKESCLEILERTHVTGCQFGKKRLFFKYCIECTALANLECPPLGSIECTALAKLECPPLGSIECTALANLECPPLGSIECTVLANLECPPLGSIECTALANLDCPPLGSIECTALAKLECPPLGSIECTALANLECPPLGSIECTALANLECPPLGRIECTALANLDCPPLGSIECTDLASLGCPPLENFRTSYALYPCLRPLDEILETNTLHFPSKGKQYNSADIVNELEQYYHNLRDDQKTPHPTTIDPIHHYAF